MKTSKNMCTVGTHKDLVELDSTELRLVQGGDLGLVMAGLIGLSKLNDYLAKLAVEAYEDATAIPIEPIT